MRLGIPVLCAVVLLSPAAARADVETTMAGSGALVVTWQGDPGRGCAEQGVCDVAGALVLEPAAEQSTSTSSGTGLEGSSVSLTFDPGVVRVTRGPPSDPRGVCTDAVSDTELRLETFGPGPARLTFESFVGPPGLSAARCAGPTGADLAATALPAFDVPRSALDDRVLRLDLGGRRSSGAGPYAVQVDSSLTLTARRRTVRDTDGEDAARELERRRGRRTERRTRLTVTYELTASGALGARFAGLAGRGCELLDACGLAGAFTLRPARPVRGELIVHAFGPTSLALGGNEQRALDALRAGRLRVADATVEPDATEEPPARLGAEAGRAGEAAVCRDGRDVSLPLLDGERAGGGLELALDTDSTSETYRTRCPGPAPGLGILARGTVGRDALTRERTNVRLAVGRTGTWPYAVEPTETLDVTLRRVGAVVRVVEEER